MRAGVTEIRPQMKPWIAAIHAYVPGRSTGADGRVRLVGLKAVRGGLEIAQHDA